MSSELTGAWQCEERWFYPGVWSSVVIMLDWSPGDLLREGRLCWNDCHGVRSVPGISLNDDTQHSLQIFLQTFIYHSVLKIIYICFCADVLDCIIQPNI